MLAGLGASIHGETLFDRSSRSGCGVGGRWPDLPGDGGAVWRERGERGEVVATLSGDGERSGLLDGRASPSCPGRRARLVAGTAGRETGPDIAGAGG